MRTVHARHRVTTVVFGGHSTSTAEYTARTHSVLSSSHTAEYRISGPPGASTSVAMWT